MDLAVCTREAIDRAIAFLLQGRGRDGWWRDFDTLAGASDEWVSAYVALALARARDGRALRAAHETWRRLRLRHWWSRGWGYNRAVPADADTTLHVLALADQLEIREGWRMRRARRLLLRHTGPDGGVRTYASPLPIRLFTGLGTSVSFAGWCGAHVCVSALASAVRFEARARALMFVRSAQQSDGSWHAYWWEDPEYATALAVNALEGFGQTDRAALDGAAHWTIGQAIRCGTASPFQCALRLRILTACGQPSGDAAHRHAAQLTETQRRDGSWEPSARLRIPPPGMVDPDQYDGWTWQGRGGGSVQVDRHSLFTTATVLGALTAMPL